jgi:steroid delta-isomerase-like uncharacterized protein
MARVANDAAVAARTVVEDYLGTGDLSTLDALSPDVVVNSPLREEPFRGLEGFREYAGTVRRAFPDVRFEIHDCIADDRGAALRWTLHATHTGPLAFLPGTGRSVEVEALEVYRVDAEGRVTEILTRLNPIRFFEQVGLVPEGMGPETPPPRPVAKLMELWIAYLRSRAPAYVPPAPASADVEEAAGDGSQTDRTRGVARAVFEQYIRDNDLSDVSLLAPDFELYTHARAEPFAGPDGLRSFLAEIHGGFPDARFTLEQLVAEGRTAFLRWSLQATNLGPLFDFPPTRRPVRITALELLRLDEDDRLRQVKLVLDPLSVLRQVGLLPRRVPGPVRWLIGRRVGKGAP